MTSAPYTVRIKKDATRRLVFEVVDGEGSLLARSAPYSSICKLEAGLALLIAAGQDAGRAVIDRGEIATAIGPGGRRGRVRVTGDLSPNRIREILASLPEAVVSDDRSPGERRYELSGRLCDLHQ